MARFYMLYDDELEMKVRGPAATASNSSIDEDFNVSSTPTSVFSTNTDFAASDQLDVYLNGVLQEGDVDYTRDSANNEITLSQSVTQSWVRVRIFKFSTVDEYFTVTGSPQSSFVIGSATITSGAKIDVYVNGILQQEGASADFERNTGTNSIVFNEAIPVDALVLVRIW